ncbi:hypothetical protein POX_f07402 [Penicillium oxalicum]|uniref:hypothetical protein n=1 Tax=Penicillium oxalicum TaxID=69781 RepID=UPI0020B6D8CA|nr:hypothetical protein POX_f07402 [Penicillium oxalicum]KAI2787047.1 hypothetical protein POX_f07402 [Penicillium oxalicum]
MHHRALRAGHRTSNASDATPLMPRQKETHLGKMVRYSPQEASRTRQKSSMASGNAVKSRIMFRLPVCDKLPAPEAWWGPCRTERTKRGQMSEEPGTKSPAENETGTRMWLLRMAESASSDAPSAEVHH